MWRCGAVSPTTQTRELRATAINEALREAQERADRLELPSLTGGQDRACAAGVLIRDRALALIERDLIHPGSQRRFRVEGRDVWAGDWWIETLLPAARTRTTAAWWIRRAPRAARAWADLLDPQGE